MRTICAGSVDKRIPVLVLFALFLWAGGGIAEDHIDTIKLDWAYYNPLSLVIKDKGLLDKEFKEDGVKIEWAQSLGSNKALELLRSKSVDFGSAAGAAALLGRANGNPIKAIYVYSNPEWTALVTKPDSGISRIQDLKGKRVAVTRGTDPHIFLLRALSSVGLTEKDIELVPLQHPDGKTALEKGSVDAWAGLDPYTAQLEVEKGYILFFRNKQWNSYGILNVRESFAKDHPELVRRVLAVYEQARLWTLDHQSEARQILAGDAKLTDAVAAKVWERTDFTNSAIGPIQRETIRASGDILKQSQVIDPGTDVDRVVADLIDPEFFPSRVVDK
ncbi:MAG: aliphatic sulfonate ABC transporter substrate-binding protein [Verrucomicrobia bacterium]|nr:aliphatic sulfonate ABC transporter substrate-binding protein [Verrucomicrobiota bacterium]